MGVLSFLTGSIGCAILPPSQNVGKLTLPDNRPTNSWAELSQRSFHSIVRPITTVVKTVSVARRGCRGERE